MSSRTEATRVGNEIERLPNELVAVVALHRLGGAHRRVDLEEIAIACYDLAQRRFSWAMRDHPNLAITLEALTDARRKRKHPPYVEGSNRKGKGVRQRREGFMLTPEGTTVASELVASVGLGSLADRSALRREETAELDRLVGHETFSVTSRGDEPLSPVHIAEIIGLLPDAPPIVVSQRLMELQALARAAARSDIEEYLEWLRMVLNS